MAIFKIMCLEAQGSDTFYGVDTMIASRQAQISFSYVDVGDKFWRPNVSVTSWMLVITCN